MTDTNKKLHLILFIALVLVLFQYLGKQPLILEEPRRAIVSMEMQDNNKYLVPTEFGELYYNKPPVWNWVINLSFFIFNSNNEFTVRFFSVFFLLSTGLLLFYFGKKYVDYRFGVYSGFFYIISVDLLFYFSTLGEIDIFYSFITLCAFLFPFHFYRQNKYNLVYIYLYLFSAIGFLTKGIPSILFLGSVLLAICIQTKKLSVLFKPGHIIGGGVFVALVGGYFYAYSVYTNPLPFIENLFFQSTERIQNSDGMGGIIKHLFIFPFETLKNLVPAALFIPLLFNKKMKSIITDNHYTRYLLLVFVINIPVYWLSEDTRQRYIYMLYPALINIIIYAITKIDLQHWQHKYSRTIVYIMFFTSSVTALTLMFIPSLNIVQGIYLKASAIAIILILLAIASYIFQLGKLTSVIALFIVFRLAFNLVVIPYRANTGDGQKEKQLGLKINQLAGAPVHFYKESLISRTTVYYLYRAQNTPVKTVEKMQEGGWYIINPTEYTLPKGCTLKSKLTFKNWPTHYLIKYNTK